MLWQKAGGDTWGTPSVVTAAITAVDPFSATSSATVTIPDASVVMCLVGLRDDSTTLARSTTSIGDDGSPTVTWNGNYVESPAAHFTSTTGLDMAGDLGHRFVTTGAAGVNLTIEGNPVAAETGSAKWIVQGLFVSDPKLVTPGTASLATATLAPTVTASDNKLVTPGVASLTTSTFASTVTASDHKLVVPGLIALATSTFAPNVTASNHQTVTPGVAALSLTTFAPAVAVGGDVGVVPGTASLALTAFAPTVSTPVVVAPAVLVLALTAFPPTVTATDPKLVTPSIAALILTAFA